MGVFGKLFGKSDAEPSSTYQGLRQQVFRVRPQDIGLLPSSEEPIFGIVMETGMDGDVATFACLADGTVSLYLSNGGGIIGAGQHDVVRSAAKELLKTTNAYALDYIAAASPGLQQGLPQDGRVHFSLLTYSGPHSVECDEKALAEHQDPFAHLFGNCHAVLAEVREVSDKPPKLHE